VLSGGMKAGQAATRVAERIGTAAWSKLPPKAQRTLAKVWSAAKVVEHKAMIGFTKGKELAQAVARERGLSAEHVERVGKIIAIADQALTWSGASFAVGAAAGGLVAGKLAAYVPVASLGYIAYSGVRNPFALVRAARSTLKSGTAHKGLGVNDADAYRDAVAVLLERAADEEFLALVAVAFDQTHDLAEAVRLAEQAGPLEYDEEGDDSTGWGLEEDEGEGGRNYTAPYNISGQAEDQGDKGLPGWGIKSNIPEQGTDGLPGPGGPSADHPMGRNLSRVADGSDYAAAGKPPQLPEDPAAKYTRIGKPAKGAGKPSGGPGQGQGPVYLVGPLRALQQALGPLAATVNRLPPGVRQLALQYATGQLHRLGEEVGPFRARQLLAAAALLAAAPVPGSHLLAVALLEGAYLACQARRDADVRDVKGLGNSAQCAELPEAVLAVLHGWYATLGLDPPRLPPELVEQALGLVVEGEDGEASGRALYRPGGEGQGQRRALYSGSRQGEDQGVGRAPYRPVRWPASFVPPSPFRHRKGLHPYPAKGSWFADCPRDKHGRCLPKGAAGGGQAGAAAPAPPEGESPKARRPGAKYVAKLSRFTSPAVKRRIAHALKNEAEFAQAAGGWNVPDSAAFDVIVAVDPGGEFIDKPDRLRSLLRQREDVRRRLKADPEGPQAGELRDWLASHQVIAVEVKTLWTAAAGKVRMSPKAVRRKQRYAERVGATSATLIFDDRRGRKHSGNRLYLKAGVGTARLDQAQAVDDFGGVLDRLLQGGTTA
jgi:hypothetical protein